ncbi:tetratricopeptide repeat protein [Candidatus Latescibacterota bacterium]
MASPLKKSFAAEQLRRRKKSPLSKVIAVVAVIIAIIAVGYALYMRPDTEEVPVEAVAPPEETPITSLAVLPLDNMIGDSEQEFFCEGMHEALIAELSTIMALRVISRTSAMRFKDTDKSLPDIAVELGVDAIVEGSVFRTGNTVRITAQLVQAEPEQHLWANTFDRGLEDVLALYSDVARAIADEIKITITPEEKERLSSTRTVNPEAYDLYILGRHFKRIRNRKMALDYQLQAVEKDSSFAAPYAEIAFHLANSGRIAEAPLKAYIEANNTLERAFELDDTLPGAYLAQAILNMYYEWDWRTAEDNFRRAIEIDPSYTDTYALIENLFTFLGKGQEALELQRKALEIDPLSLFVMSNTMSTLEYLGDYEEAMQLHQRIVEIDSTYANNYRYAGIIYAAQGKYEEAIAAFTKYWQLWGYSGTNPDIGYVYALMGKREEAEKILTEFQTEYPEEVFSLNYIRLGLKDFNPIFEWLENLYNERSPSLVDALRFYQQRSKDIVADPRWNELMRKLGLPES